MTVEVSGTHVYKVIDSPNATDAADDGLSDGGFGSGDDIGGDFGPSDAGSEFTAGGLGPIADRRDQTPMTGSHIPGVDTGAKNGQTSYIDGNGQMQTIGAGAGSFSGSAGSSGNVADQPHPIYRQLADQLAGQDADGTGEDSASGGDAANDGVPSSAEPLEGQGTYVDYFMSPDADVQGASPDVDVTLPAFADDPQAGADAQLGEDGKWYTYAHSWLNYASGQAPGSVPLDIASINAANAAYEAAAQAGLDGAPDYAQKVADANTANNVMIKANGWSYAPAPQPDTTTLPTVTVGANARDFADGPAPTEDDAGPNRSGDAAPFADAPGPALNGEPGLNGANANYPDRSPGERGSDTPTAGTPPPPAPSNPDANEAPSTLARINGKISGFNDLVKDDLVDQGAQADRDGDRAGFVWNGIQYAIYNTVMPNSVQEAVIDTVGGPIIGKSLGWLGKIATHLWPGLGKGIGNLAAGLALKLHWFDRYSPRVLRQALEEAGHVAKPGDRAHHMAAARHALAAPARKVLQQFGIGINEAGNGVFLAEDFHRFLHSAAHYERYYKTVNEALKSAHSKDDVLKILERIRQKLLTETLP